MFTVPASVKQNPIKRWALSDRVFFACGACHILAYTALNKFPDAGFKAVLIKPHVGFTGNHIVAVRNDTAFDYHGWTDWNSLLKHTRHKANRWWPGWNCDLITLPSHVLISEPLSKSYDGLWLREPRQFLHDPLPRAERFLERFPVPDCPPRKLI